MNEPTRQQTSGDQSPNIRSDGGAVSITYNNASTTLGTVIPNFLAQAFNLLVGPRRFFAAFQPGHAKALNQALLFLVLAALAAFLLRAPAYGGAGEYWRQALVTTVAYVPTALAFGAVAYGACRLVGGSGTLRAHVTVFCYLAGISSILFALVVLLAQGVVAVGLPEQVALYREYVSLFFVDPEAVRDARFEPLEAGHVLEAAMGTLLGGTLAILAWLALGWRAMADVAGLRGPRVLASLAIFLVVGYLVDRLLALVHLARGISII